MKTKRTAALSPLKNFNGLFSWDCFPEPNDASNALLAPGRVAFGYGVWVAGFRKCYEGFFIFSIWVISFRPVFCVFTNTYTRDQDLFQAVLF